MVEPGTSDFGGNLIHHGLAAPPPLMNICLADMPIKLSDSLK